MKCSRRQISESPVVIRSNPNVIFLVDAHFKCSTKISMATAIAEDAGISCPDDHVYTNYFEIVQRLPFFMLMLNPSFEAPRLIHEL